MSSLRGTSRGCNGKKHGSFIYGRIGVERTFLVCYIVFIGFFCRGHKPDKCRNCRARARRGSCFSGYDRIIFSCGHFDIFGKTSRFIQKSVEFSLCTCHGMCDLIIYSSSSPFWASSISSKISFASSSSTSP